MDKHEWISQLGRIYAEVESVEQGTGAKEHTDQFNRVLSQLKKEFPNNEFVQGTESVSVDAWGQRSANQEVKMKCGQLADALGHDVPEKKLQAEGDITVISMDAEQSMSQEVSIDQVIEMVNHTALGEAEKKELQEVIQQFEDELDGDRDANRLRKLLNKAAEYSIDTTAKLAMLALQKGVTGVLNLG